MQHKVYKVTDEDNLLLNLDSFSTSSYSMCKVTTDINFIEVSYEDGVYFEQKWNTLISEVEDEEEQDLIKEQLHQELIEKGYDITNLVQPIIE